MVEPRVSDLTDLLGVANLFAPLLPTDPDRVEALIDFSIAAAYGKKPLSQIARLAFGLHEKTRNLADPTPRYEVAYEVYLSVGDNKFSSFTSRYLPAIGNDIATQVTKLYDDENPKGWPVAAEIMIAETADDPPITAQVETKLPDDQLGQLPTERWGSPPPPESFKEAVTRAWRWLGARWMTALLFVVAAVGLVVVFFVYGLAEGKHDATTATPGRGTVVDARTGKAVEHPKVEPPPEGEHPQVGTLGFCNISSGESCQSPAADIYYTEAKPFVARSGDEIEARFLLFAGGTGPVPYLRLEVRAERYGGQTQTEMEGRVIWPTANGPNGTYTTKELALPKYGSNFQMIEAKGAPLTRVAYVPGSTKLIAEKGKQLAVLPDGIMGRRGVYLTDLGPPANCLCMGGQYIREITFRFKVLDEKQ